VSRSDLGWQIARSLFLVVLGVILFVSAGGFGLYVQENHPSNSFALGFSVYQLGASLVCFGLAVYINLKEKIRVKWSVRPLFLALVVFIIEILVFVLPFLRL
jgi:hypothetical protein